MPFSKEDIALLVKQYTPVLYLHELEPHLPCSVQWFITRSSLQLATDRDQHGKATGFRVLIEAGGVTVEALLETSKEHDPFDLYLIPDESAQGGCPKDKLADVPVYANVKEVVNPLGYVEAIEINYLTLYTHNAPYTVLGYFKCGEHTGDWEHMTVRLDGKTGALQGVYYNAHRSWDGNWLPAEQVPLTPEGRPIGYVAVGHHGIYSKAGLEPRCYFFANDHCGKGLIWSPKCCVLLPCASEYRPSQELMGRGERGSTNGLQIVASRGTSLPLTTIARASTVRLLSSEVDVQVIEEDARWQEFRGSWGRIPSPALQGWYGRAEPPVSRGLFLRIFCECWPEPQNLPYA